MYSGVEVPVSVADIPLFEELNGISCNVFEYDEENESTHIKLLYRSDKKYTKTVNLLMVEDNGRRHYILIKSMEPLMRTKTQHKGKIYTCDRCFRGFYTPSSFRKHDHFCKTGEPEIEMPEDSVMKFKNFHNRFPNAIVIYADFEAYQIPMDSKISEKTSLIREQRPTGYCYIVVSPFPQLSQQTVVYRGEDAAKKFVDAIHHEYEKVKSVLETVAEMTFFPSDAEKFDNSTTCIICRKHLDWNDEQNPVRRDHCHISGKFRGAAHNTCNINAPQEKRIFVYFHNGKGYDNHFLIEALADNKKTSNIRIIGNTKEKYVQIKTHRFCIHDSMSHLSAGLDNLADSLRTKGAEHFTYVRNEFPNDQQFKCAIKKLVYPYDYITDFSKFNEGIGSLNFEKSVM